MCDVTMQRGVNENVTEFDTEGGGLKSGNSCDVIYERPHITVTLILTFM